MTSSQARADAASRLSKGLRAISDEASGVLHEEAIRIFESEGLSYRQIAKRLGISKTLAHQIIKARELDLDQTSQSTSAAPRRPAKLPDGSYTNECSRRPRLVMGNAKVTPRSGVASPREGTAFWTGTVPLSSIVAEGLHG